MKILFLGCLLVVFVLCSVGNGKCESTESFVVSFQEGIKNIDYHVDNQWMEYTGEIPSIKDFTACHWMNIRYFSKELMPIWSYCMIRDEKERNDTDCLQISFIPVPESANRNVKTQIFLPWYRIKGRVNKATHILLKPFKHRSWNHVCWTYSSNPQCHRVYYNGIKMGEECDKDHEISTWSDNIPSSKNVSKHRVILGQEQDEVRKYNFDYRQTINGKLTEVNIWSYVMNSTQIKNLSRCKSFPKGDILLWDYNLFKFHNVTNVNVKNLSFLCDEEKMVIISTERQPFQIARHICQVHGGRLVVPRSEKENDEVIKLLQKHESSCLMPETCRRSQQLNQPKCYKDEPAVWIGLRQKGETWFELDNLVEHHAASNWTNWESSGTGSGWGNANCAYMKGNGKWRYGTKQKCESVVLKLCPVCYVFGSPAFTVNGFDKIKWIDWNFYQVLNNVGQVESYDGYKNAKIIKDGKKWKFYPKNGNLKKNVELLITNSTLYPTGRHEWNQYAIDGNIESGTKPLISFSHCHFGEEFTCNSGRCVDKTKRCDHIKDCKDGSDEKNCSYLSIPQEYLNTTSPGNGKSSPVKLKTQINILSIDSIDTSNMIVALTLEIRIRWIDGRLTYHNLIDNERNFIPTRSASGIWLPLDNIIFVDSVIGETYKDDTKEIVVRASNAIGTDADNSYEDSLYNGTNNELEMTQIFKVLYKCTFDLYKFPFDQKVCEFSLKMRRVEKLTSILVKDSPSIIYDGPKTIHQFKIGNQTSSTHVSANEETTFKFTIELRRNYMHQIFATYFPTFLLWLLTYATLFIDVDDFDNRFQGSVTALLVLAALLNAITNSLPKTSYLKLIDLWFFWHTIGIFSLIIFHIVLAKVYKANQYKVFTIDNIAAQNGFIEPGVSNEASSDQQTVPNEDAIEDKKKSNCFSRNCGRIQFNRAAIVIIPILSVVFYLDYFYFTTTH